MGKQLNSLQKKSLCLNTFLRLALPLWIFINPIQGVIIGVITDGIDYYLLVRHAKLSNSKYQYQDKIFDYYWYVLIIIYAYLHISDYLILKMLICTFIFRTIGHIIYLQKHDERIFLYFPNIFEPIFWIWTFNPSYLNSFTLLPTLIIILFIKISIEYYVHIIHVNPLNQFFHFLGLKTNF